MLEGQEFLSLLNLWLQKFATWAPFLQERITLLQENNVKYRLANSFTTVKLKLPFI